MILYHLQLFYLQKTKNKLFYDDIEISDYRIRIPSIDNLFVCNKQMQIINLYNCYDIDSKKKELIKLEIQRLILNNLHKYSYSRLSYSASNSSRLSTSS